GLRRQVILRPATELLEGDYEVWYSVTILADAWDRNRAGRVKTRVESLGALQDQPRVLGGDRKSFRVSGTRQTIKMRRRPTEYVARVLERTGLGAESGRFVLRPCYANSSPNWTGGHSIW